MKPPVPCWEYRLLNLGEGKHEVCNDNTGDRLCSVEGIVAVRYVDIRTYPTANHHLYFFCTKHLEIEIIDVLTYNRDRCKGVASMLQDYEAWSYSIDSAEQVLNSLKGYKLNLKEVQELLRS